MSGVVGIDEEFLIKTFDHRMETLKEIGCPKEIIEKLSAQKATVIETSRKIFQSSNLPYYKELGTMLFMPVIPFIEEMTRQLTLSRWDLTCIRFIRRVKNLIATPEEPYFIYEVQEGSWNNFELKEKESHYKKLGYRGLTMAEVVAFNVHYFRDLQYVEGVSMDHDIGGIVEEILHQSTHPLEIDQTYLKRLIENKIGYRYRFTAYSIQGVVALGSRFRPSVLIDEEFIPYIGKRSSPNFITFDPRTYNLPDLIVPFCLNQGPKIYRHVKTEEVSSKLRTEDDNLEDEEWFKEAKEMFSEELSE